ncbi:hypothetical protein IWW35_006772, partial [Coemansia sp. RSA 1878]
RRVQLHAQRGLRRVEHKRAGRADAHIRRLGTPDGNGSGGDGPDGRSPADANCDFGGDNPREYRDVAAVQPVQLHKLAGYVEAAWACTRVGAGDDPSAALAYGGAHGDAHGGDHGGAGYAAQL